MAVAGIIAGISIASDVVGLIGSGLSFGAAIAAAFSSSKNAKKQANAGGNNPEDMVDAVQASNFYGAAQEMKCHYLFMALRPLGILPDSKSKWMTMTNYEAQDLLRTAAMKLDNVRERWFKRYMSLDANARLVKEQEGIRVLEKYGKTDYYYAMVQAATESDLSDNNQTSDNLVQEALVKDQIHNEMGAFMAKLYEVPTMESNHGEETVELFNIRQEVFGFAANRDSGIDDDLPGQRSGVETRQSYQTGDDIIVPGESVDIDLSFYNIANLPVELPPLDETQGGQALRATTIASAADFYEIISNAAVSSIESGVPLTGRILMSQKPAVRAYDRLGSDNQTSDNEKLAVRDATELVFAGCIEVFVNDENGVKQVFHYDLPAQLIFPNEFDVQNTTGVTKRYNFASILQRYAGEGTCSQALNVANKDVAAFDRTLSIDECNPVGFSLPIMKFPGIQSSSLPDYLQAGKWRPFVIETVYNGTFNPISVTVPNMTGYQATGNVAIVTWSTYALAAKNMKKIQYIGHYKIELQLSGSDSWAGIVITDPMAFPTQKCSGPQGPFAGNLFYTLQVNSEWARQGYSNAAFGGAVQNAGTSHNNRGGSESSFGLVTVTPTKGSKLPLKYVSKETGRWETLEGPLLEVIGAYADSSPGVTEDGIIVSNASSSTVKDYVQNILPSSMAWSATWPLYANLRGLNPRLTAEEFMTDGPGVGKTTSGYQLSEVPSIVKEFTNFVSTYEWYNSYVQNNTLLGDMTLGITVEV